eukprot:5515088-Prymnesium_polylepis.1
MSKAHGRKNERRKGRIFLFDCTSPSIIRPRRPRGDDDIYLSGGHATEGGSGLRAPVLPAAAERVGEPAPGCVCWGG